MAANLSSKSYIDTAAAALATQMDGLVGKTCVIDNNNSLSVVCSTSPAHLRHSSLHRWVALFGACWDQVLRLVRAVHRASLHAILQQQGRRETKTLEYERTCAAVLMRHAAVHEYVC